MECLFKRKYGNPTWTWADNFSGRTYPQSWTNAPGRDSSLEYRLSIYHAQLNDSGSYTCSTPFEQRHTIKIVVKDVECPKIEATHGLHARCHQICPIFLYFCSIFLYYFSQEEAQ